MVFFLLLALMENYFLEVISKEEILDCKICSKEECFPVIDSIIPLSKERFLIFYDSKIGLKLFKGNKKFKNFKILDEGNLENSLGAIYIEDLDLENYNYLLNLDEKGKPKLVSIIDKREKEEEVNFSERKHSLNQKEVKRAVYFWDTIDILKKEKEWEELIRKLKILKIEIIYIQVPYEIFKEEKSWIKKRGKIFYKFLNSLMEKDFKVEFLDGWKGYALKPLHYRVLNQITYLKYFWKKYFPNKVFPVIHLDIEPYLLRFCNSKNLKDIYNQYVELLKKIKKFHPELKVNIDIPFWLDNLKGGEQILDDILNNTEAITVMAYRSQVSGPSGMIKAVEKEVNMAKDKDKEIYIAIETMKLPPEVVFQVFEKNDENYPFYLKETKKKNLYLLTNEVSQYGVKILEETSGNKISFFEKNWEELENILEEISLYYGSEFKGIAIHHWGSIKEKIK